MLPVVVASILLFLPCNWAGDPCPPKSELKSCSCTHSNLRREVSVTTSFKPRRHEFNILTSASASPPPTEDTPATQSPGSNISAIEIGLSGRRRHNVDGDKYTNSSLYTVVDCRDIRTITDLEETFLFALHRKSVDKLIVSNLPPAKEETLARLPSGGLRNTRIQQFEIRDSILSGDFIWYGNPFQGQDESLLRLTVNRCHLYGALTYEEPGTINTKGLQLLPHIECVDFSINHLTIIKASAFRYPPANLSSIVLSRNSLQTLEVACFGYVPLLRMVDLSHNLLKKLVRTIFAGTPKFLETINLSGNFLNDLPADFFANMPALKIVNLSKNFLHSMPAKPWATAWRQLTFVDVTGNFVDCDCHLLWLLPILSPTKGNTTSTPAPSPLDGQTVRGNCNFRMPDYTPIQHTLVSLTRDKFMCT